MDIVIVVLIIILSKTLVSLHSINVKRKKIELEKIRCQKEILEFEIQMQNNQIKLLEEENKKYDRIIWEQ
ncbi:hypothetical protein FACS189476_02800 [Spirochaetia bacterium]|nr:hypothetical protein FACS189476_02800 [Spirochaetia bacterium]